MNTRHLSLFFQVVEHGSITEAAKSAMSSQPAVSMQLKRLEEQLGVVLFHAHPRGVTLTDAGSVFYEYAKRMLTLEAQCVREMAEYRVGQRGQIVIGTTPTVGTYLLPKRLGEFRRKRPTIDLTMEFLEGHLIEDRVRDGSLDMGVTLEVPLEHYALRVTNLVADEWVLMDGALNHSVSTVFAPLDAPRVLEGATPTGAGVMRVHHQEAAVRMALAGLGGAWVLRSVAKALDERMGADAAIVDVPSIPTMAVIVTRPAERLARSLRLLLEDLQR